MSEFSKFPAPFPVMAGLLAVIFGAAWTGGPAGSGMAEAASGCPKAQALPRVSLKTRPGRIIYDNRLSRKRLRVLQGRSGAAGRKKGWQPIGLTLTELQFRMNISVSTLSRPNRGHCATVSAVEATLGYDKITVYLDKRYRKGSCQHLSVLEHEKEHVAIFRDTLARYAPKVERRLTRAAAGLKPVSASSPNLAAEKLQKALQRQMEPLFKEMNRTLDRENDRIDTSVNYKREQARCSKW